MTDYLQRGNPPNEAQLCYLHFEDSSFKRDIEVPRSFCSFFADSKVLIISFLRYLEILKKRKLQDNLI